MRDRAESGIPYMPCESCKSKDKEIKRLKSVILELKELARRLVPDKKKWPDDYDLPG